MALNENAHEVGVPLYQDSVITKVESTTAHFKGFAGETMVFLDATEEGVYSTPRVMISGVVGVYCTDEVEKGDTVYSIIDEDDEDYGKVTAVGNETQIGIALSDSTDGRVDIFISPAKSGYVADDTAEKIRNLTDYEAGDYVTAHGLTGSCIIDTPYGLVLPTKGDIDTVSGGVLASDARRVMTVENALATVTYRGIVAVKCTSEIDNFGTPVYADAIYHYVQDVKLSPAGMIKPFRVGTTVSLCFGNATSYVWILLNGHGLNSDVGNRILENPSSVTSSERFIVDNSGVVIPEVTANTYSSGYFVPSRHAVALRTYEDYNDVHKVDFLYGGIVAFIKAAGASTFNVGDKVYINNSLSSTCNVGHNSEVTNPEFIGVVIAPEVSDGTNTLIWTRMNSFTFESSSSEDTDPYDVILQNPIPVSIDDRYVHSKDACIIKFSSYGAEYKGYYLLPLGGYIVGKGGGTYNRILKSGIVCLKRDVNHDSHSFYIGDSVYIRYNTTNDGNQYFNSVVHNDSECDDYGYALLKIGIAVSNEKSETGTADDWVWVKLDDNPTAENRCRKDIFQTKKCQEDECMLYRGYPSLILNSYGDDDSQYKKIMWNYKSVVVQTVDNNGDEEYVAVTDGIVSLYIFSAAATYGEMVYSRYATTWNKIAYEESYFSSGEWMYPIGYMVTQRNEDGYAWVKLTWGMPNRVP